MLIYLLYNYLFYQCSLCSDVFIKFHQRTPVYKMSMYTNVNVNIFVKEMIYKENEWLMENIINKI